MPHKFHIGETVSLVSTFNPLRKPNAACKVIRQLPEADGSLQYRVQVENETFERLVKERDLRARAMEQDTAKPPSKRRRPSEPATTRSSEDDS
jgi:hypothetical protein